MIFHRVFFANGLNPWTSHLFLFALSVTSVVPIFFHVTHEVHFVGGGRAVKKKHHCFAFRCHPSHKPFEQLRNKQEEARMNG